MEHGAYVPPVCNGVLERTEFAWRQRIDTRISDRKPDFRRVQRHRNRFVSRAGALLHALRGLPRDSELDRAMPTIIVFCASLKL